MAATLAASLALAAGPAHPPAAQTGGPDIAERSGTRAATASGGVAAPYARARELIAAGRLDAAEHVLRAWRPATAAETEQRHWALATLLRGRARHREALTHLEPLVAARPDVPQFRIALGETLLALGQRERAALHLGEARATAPAPADRARAEQALAQAEALSEWSGHLSLSIEPSSNGARRTSAETIVIGGIPFIIGAGARAQPSTALSLNAGIAFAPAVAGRTRLRFALSGFGRLHDGSASDEALVRAEVALIHQRIAGGSIQGGLTWSRRWIDGRPYSGGPGLTFGYSTFPTPRTRFDVAAVVDLLTHDTSPALDGTRSFLVLAQTFAVSPQLHLRGVLRLERHDARFDAYAFTAGELTLGATRAFRGGLRMDLDIGYRRAAHDAVNPFFGRRREEDRWSATLRTTHARLGVAGFAPEATLGWERQRSSIAVYSYDNLSAGIGLTKKF